MRSQLGAYIEDFLKDKTFNPRCSPAVRQRCIL